VEDNVTNRIVAEAMLKKLGYNADMVVNGLEAVNRLKTSVYDIIFMDLQMPVMGGFEATEKIRDPQSGVLDNNAPIVAMTANAMKGDREKCLDIGMDDYVAKPVTQEMLRTVLEKWLLNKHDAEVFYMTEDNKDYRDGHLDNQLAKKSLGAAPLERQDPGKLLDSS